MSGINKNLITTISKTSNNVTTVEDIEKYASADGINPLKYYVYKYGQFPNKLNFDSFSNNFQKTLGNNIVEYDQKKFIKLMSNTFEDALFNFNQYCDELTETICVYTTISIDSKKLVAYVDSTDDNGLIIYYDNLNDAKKVFSLYLKCMKKIAPPAQTKKISLIVAKQGQYDLIESEVKQVEVNINKHYNDDFKKADKVIKEFISEENTSGIVILNGVKGTGKTTYIRHLINSSDRRFIYLTKEMATALTDPSFITFLLSVKGSVLVIEDCENLVAARNQGNQSTGISNLLNMCDGLLSDVFNIKIIATFNEDIAKVDSALLRKGRLIYHYEFAELDVEKTNKLLKSLKIKHVSDVPMTLADIFNYEKDNGEILSNKKKKIGFGE